MVIHRYVGIVMGVLMLLWFASGVAMLFVHWPEVSETERVAGQPAIVWAECCDFGRLRDEQQVTHAVVEDLAGRPVLRFDGEVLDLATGVLLHHVGAAEAIPVAEAYAAAHGVPVNSPAGPELVERDQWTVTGYFDKRRPFWVLRLDDPRRTDIYVSAHTGQVAQVTDRPTRILNWLGPIPHWLYPSVLRADTRLWSQVVIWTSLIGTFLTLTGLYLGIVAWRPWRDARVTPFRDGLASPRRAGRGRLTSDLGGQRPVSMPLGLPGRRRAIRGEPAAFGFGDLRRRCWRPRRRA